MCVTELLLEEQFISLYLHNACCHGYFSIFLIKNLILLIKLKHVKQ